MKKLPDNYSEYDGEILMSNFDGKINQKTTKVIRNKDLFSHYAGWNFNGKVWWDDNNWNCAVWVYGNHRETVTRQTLGEIMTEVSDEYGYE